jgi:hypothetical protein
MIKFWFSIYIYYSVESNGNYFVIVIIIMNLLHYNFYIFGGGHLYKGHFSHTLVYTL